MAKYKRQSIVAGSPAINEHEDMMEKVLSDNDTTENVGIGSGNVTMGGMSGGLANVSKNETPLVENTKNVQTRVPLSVYEKLNRLKYFSGQRTSIGDLVLRAIEEYVVRHGEQ